MLITESYTFFISLKYFIYLETRKGFQRLCL